MGTDDKKNRYAYDFDIESFLGTDDVKTESVKEEKHLVHTEEINIEPKKPDIRNKKSSATYTTSFDMEGNITQY